MGWFEHKGSRIYFEEAGQGTPVLFLPGWSESIDEFKALTDGLSAKFRVVAADLPGSGKSEPQPREYRPTYYEDDAQSFLALLNELGTGPAHVVGFSDGGETALVMAIQKPEALRSLVAWGAAGRIAAPPEMLDVMHTVVDAPIEPMIGFSDHLKGMYGEANARAMTQSVSNAWRQIMESGGDISRAGAPRISAPTLLITGEHDMFAPPAIVSELAAAIPGADFLEVKGAEHVLHLDHGEWLAATITNWLTQHGA